MLQRPYMAFIARTTGTDESSASPDFLNLALQDIFSWEFASCFQELSIQNAAKIMSDKKRNSIVVMNSQGQSVGLITDNDLRSKVVSRNYPVHQPVRDIASRPLITLSAKAQEYFLQLGDKICTMLDQAGYSFCRFNVMASNPKWCQPLSVWKKYFWNWIHNAEPVDLLHSSIFFDFRTGYGDNALIDELRSYLFQTLGDWLSFFRHLPNFTIRAGMGILECPLCHIVIAIRTSRKGREVIRNGIDRINPKSSRPNPFSVYLSPGPDQPCICPTLNTGPAIPDFPGQWTADDLQRCVRRPWQ